jgi:hypothetical protein
MNISAIKASLGITIIELNWDTKEDGSINKEWASCFLPTAKAVVSVPANVIEVLGSSKNLHLVAKPDVLVKDVPYQRYILTEHKDIDPERVIGAF